MKKSIMFITACSLFFFFSCSQNDASNDSDNFNDSDFQLQEEEVVNDEDHIENDNNADDADDAAVIDDEQITDDITEKPDENDDDTSEIQDEDSDGQTKTDLELYADCVFEKVNEFRLLNGVGTNYERDEKLDEVGKYYSGYMADHNQFTHSADGMNFGERLDSYGVAWLSAGENLQKNSMFTWSSACEETVNGNGGWAKSTQGHREAMLGQDKSGVDKGWTHAGAGVAKNGNDWYVTMYFVKY